ncbi:MAG: rod shape-determining protein MreD [Candidatus Omnitrophica bacterium]|nr:rod shape-determining protein MreD [Candidatus Omnitrophota bacterium]
MRKIIFVPVCVLVLFLAEFFLFNMAGRWFMPNLLLLAIIYFNLAFGIRYSIFTAVLAGALKDSFSVGVFGINIFSFVLCAYLTTVLKRYLHYVASRRSRLLLVFLITVINILVHFFLQAMFAKIDVVQILKFVFIPEVLTTLIAASFIFAELKKCVSKLFV